jgi:hypothetical protein
MQSLYNQLKQNLNLPLKVGIAGWVTGLEPVWVRIPAGSLPLGVKSHESQMPDGAFFGVMSSAYVCFQIGVLFKPITSGLEPFCRKMIAKDDVDPEVLSKASGILKAHYPHYRSDILAAMSFKLKLKDLILRNRLTQT